MVLNTFGAQVDLISLPRCFLPCCFCCSLYFLQPSPQGSKDPNMKYLAKPALAIPYVKTPSTRRPRVVTTELYLQLLQANHSLSWGAIYVGNSYRYGASYTYPGPPSSLSDCGTLGVRAWVLKESFLHTAMTFDLEDADPQASSSTVPKPYSRVPQGWNMAVG